MSLHTLLGEVVIVTTKSDDIYQGTLIYLSIESLHISRPLKNQFPLDRYSLILPSDIINKIEFPTLSLSASTMSDNDAFQSVLKKLSAQIPPSPSEPGFTINPFKFSSPIISTEEQRHRTSLMEFLHKPSEIPPPTTTTSHSHSMPLGSNLLPLLQNKLDPFSDNGMTSAQKSRPKVLSLFESTCLQVNKLSAEQDTTACVYQCRDSHQIDVSQYLKAGANNRSGKGNKSADVSAGELTNRKSVPSRLFGEQFITSSDDCNDDSDFDQPTMFPPKNHRLLRFPSADTSTEKPPTARTKKRLVETNRRDGGGPIMMMRQNKWEEFDLEKDFDFEGNLALFDKEAFCQGEMSDDGLLSYPVIGELPKTQKPVNPRESVKSPAVVELPPDPAIIFSQHFQQNFGIAVNVKSNSISGSSVGDHPNSNSTEGNESGDEGYDVNTPSNGSDFDLTSAAKLLNQIMCPMEPPGGTTPPHSRTGFTADNYWILKGTTGSQALEKIDTSHWMSLESRDAFLKKVSGGASLSNAIEQAGLHTARAIQLLAKEKSIQISSRRPIVILVDPDSLGGAICLSAMRNFIYYRAIGLKDSTSSGGGGSKSALVYIRIIPSEGKNTTPRNNFRDEFQTQLQLLNKHVYSTKVLINQQLPLQTYNCSFYILQSKLHAKCQFPILPSDLLLFVDPPLNVFHQNDRFHTQNHALALCCSSARQFACLFVGCVSCGPRELVTEVQEIFRKKPTKPLHTGCESLLEIPETTWSIGVLEMNLSVILSSQRILSQMKTLPQHQLFYDKATSFIELDFPSFFK